MFCSICNDKKLSLTPQMENKLDDYKQAIIMTYVLAVEISSE